jgi:NADH kinase
VRKASVPALVTSLIEFIKYGTFPGLCQDCLTISSHITSTYPSISIILEPNTAAEVHHLLPCPVYTNTSGTQLSELAHDRVDLAVTLGGDGTILRACSLFATCHNVPPVLSFSMGTLGFLGEWKFAEYKRAFRELYMSGAAAGDRTLLLEDPKPTGVDQEAESGIGPTGWSSVRGKSMGSNRGPRILMRNRLRVGLFSPDGKPIDPKGDTPRPGSSVSDGRVYALNEVLIHRGKEPHLAIVEVFVGGRFLTEAVADGIIISTPTGSTAYSLSSGGSIVHPLVASLLLTPVCPRSLSFRPLVLPSNTPVTLRLSEKNRGREVEVSIDGRNMGQAMAVGMEVRVWDEEIRHGKNDWRGGVPCVMRRTTGVEEADDGWVGGLNSLLKFNYPFGER